MKPSLAILLSFCMILSGSIKTAAQNCGEPVPVFSVYYPCQAGVRFAAGLEAGYQGMDSPFGYFLGFNLRSFSPRHLGKDPADGPVLRQAFYLKGSFRLVRQEGVASLYLVAAPEMSKRTDLDLRSGLRLMFPVKGKMGLGLEPLYSLKERSVMVNFMLAF